MRLFSLSVAEFSFIKFLMSGGANTAITYFIYILLLNIFSYQESYTMAYVFGVVLAFVLGRFFVFNSHRGVRSFILFPLVYLVQYFVSMVILWVWIERLNYSDSVAPLVAILITVPITYVLSRFVFVKPSRADKVRL